MKRIVCCILIGLLLGAVCALADNGSWACPQCGQAGNTGNFCSNCACPRPNEGWLCPQCGQAGNTGNFCSNCACPKPSQAAVNEGLEQLPGETDRVKVRVGGVSASAFIQNKQNPNLWQPSNAADGDESTCWQFSSKKSGTLGNTWLELKLSSPQTVDALWFKNGFWAYGTSGKDQYPINARPKKVRVEFLYSGKTQYADALELTLKDDKARQDWQRFDVGRHTGVTAVRLWVLSAYQGSQYPNDVCLSEVMLVQNAAASTAAQASATNPPTVYESPRSASNANLKMKLATRSGPGTQYDEPGTFFANNWQSTTVRVLAKEWDGDIWWVLVDFSSGGARYRVWTGLKRVDVNVDALPELYGNGQGTVNATDTRRGPGSDYAKGPRITHWQDVVAYGRENGYVEVEYYDDSQNRFYRVWVPSSAVSLD